MQKEPNPTEDFDPGFWIVAVLDLLGLTERLRIVDFIPDSVDEAESHWAGIKDTFGRVVGVRWTLEETLRIVSAECTSRLKDAVSHDSFHLLKPGDIEYQHVADSVVVLAPVINPSRCVDVTRIFSFLSTCAGVMVGSLEARTPLRGAIEVGMAARMPSGDIFGSVTSNAHYLESKVAEYPRIVIGPKLNTMIRNRDRTVTMPEFSTAYNLLAEECVELIAIDDDNQPILDYLGKAFRERVSEQSQLPDALHTIHAFARDECDRFGSATSKHPDAQRLHARYQRMLHYVESRIRS